MSRARIAVTRALADDDPLVRAITAHGAVARLMPLLTIAPPADPAALQAALRAHAGFGLVAFTSANAAAAVAAVLAQLGIAPADAFPAAQVAAVGGATARALQTSGLRVDLCPARADAAGLLELLVGRDDLDRLRVLLPLGDRARRTLPDGLAARGAAVTEVVAYVTRAAAGDAALRLETALLNGELDVVTFASGSAVDALAAALGRERMRRCLALAAVVVIGETTAAALRAAGIRVDRLAADATMECLAATAIESWSARGRLFQRGVSMGFPERRMRRLRSSGALRDLVRETRLSPDRLVYPLFVVPGSGIRQEVSSMPGVFRQSVDMLVEDARETRGLGVPAVILFGLPPVKDARGSGADDAAGVVPRAAEALKRACPDLLVIADVCLCEYTDHGHCGIVDGERILNDPSLARLASASVAYARAGCDVVAPSDMMDGRVRAIRQALDGACFTDTPILSYAAKYCSGFYGPFRDAADSAPQFGDRRSYQMDPANAREALAEVALDVEEGADMIMVKPAMPYLDIVRQVKDRFDLPVAAYQVSGEYAMLLAAVQNGWLDRDRVMLESLTCIVRAGADFVLTYFAKDAARLLR